MVSTKKIIWTGSGLLVIFTVINAVIIKTADTYNENLFLSLLIAIAFLALVIYFIRRKKQVAVRNYYLFNKEDHPYPSQIDGLPDFINHIKIQEKDLNVLVGNSRCSQPYHADILNITAINNHGMNKFYIPSISRKSEPINLSTYITEDEISTYCLNGEDLVWQIGPEYLGCRKEGGNFNATQFKKNALRPNVKMIELKMTPASNSGYYSVSPVGFAESKNGNPVSKGILSSRHSAFRCAEGMILFIGKLQELSGGKPVGFKLFIEDKKEFYEICYAMMKTHIIPDYIVVDSPVGETNDSISTIKSDNRMLLYEALQFVSKTLQHYGLHKEIKIIAAGDIISGFDVLKMIALGADSVCANVPNNSMNTYRKWDIENSHKDAIETIIDIMKVCGFKNRNDITLAKLLTRMDMLPLKATEGSLNDKRNEGSVKIMNSSNLRMKKNNYKRQTAVL
ncbi:MAG: glutamate synthase-related protein [Chitinophagaceae bacterium]